MLDRIKEAVGIEDARDQEPVHLALAFIIGTLIGAGIAATWVPERRRSRVPDFVQKPYKRAREASSAAIEDFRRTSRDLAGDFRDELAANIEAARQEFKDLAEQQVGQVRKTLRRERKKLLR